MVSFNEVKGKVEQALSQVKNVQSQFEGLLSAGTALLPEVRRHAAIAMGVLNGSAAQGAGMLGQLQQVFTAFKYAQDAEDFIPKLFHAGWAQYGPQFMGEVARIKKMYPQYRLVDLEKGTNGAPKYKPAHMPGFFGFVKGLNPKIMTVLKSLPQNEEMMWTNLSKRRFPKNPNFAQGSKETFPMEVFDAIFRG